jgi:hypothetical protein
MPDTSTLIERVVASDPDHAVSIAALEALRRSPMRDLNTLLSERMAAALTVGNGSSVERPVVSRTFSPLPSSV